MHLLLHRLSHFKPYRCHHMCNVLTGVWHHNTHSPTAAVGPPAVPPAYHSPCHLQGLPLLLTHAPP
jgi:hypothetical protein